jgi:hypothetical protein
LCRTCFSIELFHERFFGGRKLECTYFDGKTNYKVAESEEKAKARAAEFTKWMMGDGNSNNKNAGSDTID